MPVAHIGYGPRGCCYYRDGDHRREWRWLALGRQGLTDGAGVAGQGCVGRYRFCGWENLVPFGAVDEGAADKRCGNIKAGDDRKRICRHQGLPAAKSPGDDELQAGAAGRPQLSEFGSLVSAYLVM